VNVNSGAYVDTAPGPLYYARRVVSLLFGILAVLIGLRILLLLLVANEQNDIVDFVYNVTEPFVAPFRGIFSFDTVTPGGGSVLDVAAVVALIGWLLIYILIMAILRLGDRDRAVA
ncbi:MAG: YggT family protein, partial [Chloroflexota bacterium]|nr:YggT family protein [Chloroflexota bacterium]